MFNLDGAHTLQAELRSLHRKPRGYVEEGADAEDLLAVEAQVQLKPARQTSLTGFFGAPLKPAASLPIAAATAAAATEADTAIATSPRVIIYERGDRAQRIRWRRRAQRIRPVRDALT